jgi:DNA-binding NarL/FixJ family response regulator
VKARITKKKSRVFVVEDHPIFRDGLIQMLSSESDLDICGKAGSYESGLKGIKQTAPDIALIDLELPGKSGLDLIKKIRELSIATKLLVVSMYDEALYADRVLRAGGDGYIMKQESPEEIVHAIRDVLGGHIYVSEEVSFRKSIGRKSAPKQKQSFFDRVTDLELNILELLGRGKDNREIADRLNLQIDQVTEHCKQMRKKLKIKSDNALIVYAVSWVGGRPA